MAFTKITLHGAIDTIKGISLKINGLIDDLLNTASGKGASQVGVQDSASNMDADNVEDALAEIYTDITNPRALADMFDEDSSTTTGLTWGYKAGTVRFDNTITTVAAGTVALTDDNTNYVEINSSGVVSANVTAFTSGRIPLRKIVTSGGSQSTSTDYRSWFQAWADFPMTVAKGGTGAATLTNHGVLVGSGTSAVTALGVGTTGQHLCGSTGADPAWSANLIAPQNTVMLFGQNSAPTGWTRKADWQDNAMLCYAASGNIGSGGSVNPQSTHIHSLASWGTGGSLDISSYVYSESA